MNKKILVLLALVFNAYAQTQDIKFINIGLEQGLSQSVVLDILQDDRGFLWIGTQDGLNRYDGRSFKVYKQNPTDTNTLSDNWVNSICIQNNFLWIATEYGGLNRYDILHEKFERIKLDSVTTIRCILPDRAGNIWIGTWGRGLYCLDSKTLKYKIYSERENISHNKIRSLGIDHNDNIWIGTVAGLDKLNRSTGIISHYYYDPENPNSITDNFIVSLTADKEGRMWVGTPKGITIINKDKIRRIRMDEPHPNGLSENYILCTFQDKSGSFWFGTLSGGINKLQYYDENKEPVFISYKNEPTDFNSIPTNYIRKIYQDKSQNMWIGTWGGCISRFDAKPGKFTHIKPEPSKKNRLSYPFIRAFYKMNNGDLLIGTDGNGIDYYNAAENKYYNYSFTEENFLDYNYIYSFHKDSNGDIWIGSFGGLIKWPKGKSILQELKNSIVEFNQLVPHSYIRSIMEIRNDVLVLGTREGLIQYSIKDKKVNKLQGSNLPAGSVTSFIREKNDRYWAGTINGLYHIQFKDNNPETIEKIDNEGKSIKLSSNKINALLIDRKGRFWVGTSLGLNLYEPANHSFRYILAKDGLPNEIINGLLEDEQGNIWVSTNNGLTKISDKGNSFLFRNYDVSDGLQSNEFNQSSCYQSSDGEMFFGGINGFNRFYVSGVKDNKYIPQIALTNVKIFNELIDEVRIDRINKELKLSYFENFISFDFASLDYTNPYKNQYKYKMEGFDKQWIYSGNNNYASYTNLDPGEYTFRVIASNNDGVWNNTGDYFRIIVEPPYWMTWWFRSIIVLLLIAIATVVYQNRVRRLLEIERLRVKIASDLHDEVGASLTKISMQAGLAVYEKDYIKIKPKLEKIENISREVISMMSDIIWSIDARNDTTDDLITRMKDFSFNLLSELLITFRISIDGLIPQKRLSVDIRQNIYLIYKEAINNAVKYSGACEICVTISNSGGLFIMKISDNGSGFPEELKSKGNGLRNMKMRAERIQGKLELKNENGASVIFTRKEL